MGIGIFLSDDVVQSLPSPLKHALLQELHRRFQWMPEQEACTSSMISAPAGVIDETERAADLSVAHAMRYLEGCSEKTKKVIRAIVQGESRQFRLSDLASALGVTPDDLNGVWGGLTKRTRTILNDKTSKLIVWSQNFYDENGSWTDAKGNISEVTYTSFRTALAIE